MNGALIGLGAAGIITAAAIVSTNNASTMLEPSMFQTPAREAQTDALKSVTIDVTMDMSARQIVGAIVDTHKLGASVDWGSLEEVGFMPDEPLGISGRGLSVMMILNELSRRADDSWSTIDWRLEDQMLTIDRKDVFDMRERELASYDIDGILSSMLDRYSLQYDDASDQVSSVIQEFIEPDQWVNNGGNVAQLRVVSGRMFVYAPLRTHEKVSWMLSEMAKSDGGEARFDPRMEKSSMAEPSIMPNPSPIERAQHENNQLAMSRLRNIHVGWLTWLQAHEGEKLSNLQTLVDDGMLRAADVKSPQGPANDGKDYWIDFGGFDLMDGTDWSKRVVGIDRATYEHGESVAVLFADGHIELVSKGRFVAIMDEPANDGVKPDLPKL